MRVGEERYRDIRDDRERFFDRPRRGDGRGERGFFSRASDEVRSWVGDDEAQRRRYLDRTDWDSRERFGAVRASEVMTRDVATVYPNDPIKLAARLMRQCDCGALPVVGRNDELVGMITDRDITVRLVARGIDPRAAFVRDCMTGETFKCHVDDSIEDCLDLCSRHQIRRVPVVDDRDHVVGMISQSDMALLAGSRPGRGERRALAETLCAISEPSRGAYR
jgi:CBS domain-containing protein